MKTIRNAASAPLRPLAGFISVVFLHVIVFWGLYQHRWIPSPQQAMTLFVEFIAPPQAEKKPEPPPRIAKPKPVQPPAPRLVAQAPIVLPSDELASPPPPEPPRSESPPAPPTPPAPPAMLPTGPVTLSGELAVVCPERTAPTYPSISRRLGEEGTVILRVELDESGAVINAQIKDTSGHRRLDEAALAAVKTWRCPPALRNGKPVRAVALQPFKFVLQGN